MFLKEEEEDIFLGKKENVNEISLSTLIGYTIANTTTRPFTTSDSLHDTPDCITPRDRNSSYERPLPPLKLSGPPRWLLGCNGIDILLLRD